MDVKQELLQEWKQRVEGLTSEVKDLRQRLEQRNSLTVAAYAKGGEIHIIGAFDGSEPGLAQASAIRKQLESIETTQSTCTTKFKKNILVNVISDLPH